MFLVAVENYFIFSANQTLSRTVGIRTGYVNSAINGFIAPPMSTGVTNGTMMRKEIL